MKFLKFLVVLTIGITCCMNLTSCSSEDEPKPNIEVGNGTVNPATVFANGIPQKVGGMNISVNSDGLVSALTDGSVKITFEYPCMSRATEADVIMNVKDGDDDDFVVYVTLNGLGYSSYWKIVYDQEDVEEYWFEYNTAEQLKKIKVKNDETNATVEYSYENGNIVSATLFPIEDEFSLKISYGTTLIKNNGGVMIWDMYGFEWGEEMQYAYYAGILGKATASLPEKQEVYAEGELDIEIYTWSINDKGLPTKVTRKYSDSDYTEDMLFVW
ncbi:MAG: DUF4595 domain-containing protein [Muribaculaceae bacterium]|nr:DUF4595 domain-containing protein [Muribaculaceae bacterium]